MSPSNASFFLVFLLLFIFPASSFFFFEPSPWGTSNANIEKTKVSSFRGFYPPESSETTPESYIVTVPLPFTVKKLRADKDIVFATGPLKSTTDGQKKYRVSGIRDGVVVWSYDAPSEIYIAVNTLFELIIAYNSNDTHTNVKKMKAQTGQLQWTVTLARISSARPKDFGFDINSPLAIEVVGPNMLLLTDKFLYWGLDESTGSYFWQRSPFPFDLLEVPTPVTAISIGGLKKEDDFHTYYWSSSKTNVISYTVISSILSVSPGVANHWEYRFEQNPIKAADLDPRPQVMYMDNANTVVFKFKNKIYLVDSKTGLSRSTVNGDQSFTVVAGSSLSINETDGTTKYALYTMTKNQLERIYFVGTKQISDWKVPVQGDQQQDIAIGKFFVDKNTKKGKEMIHVCDGGLTVYDSDKNVVFPRVPGCNSEIIVASDTNVVYVNGTDQVSFLNYKTPPKYTGDHLTVIVVVSVIVVLVLGGGLLGYLYFKRRRGGFPAATGGFGFGMGGGHDDDHRPLADDDDDYDSNRNNNNKAGGGDFFRQGSF